MTTRSQRKQAETARRHAVNDRQYTEHVAYIARLDRLERTGIALNQSLLEQWPTERTDQLHADYLEAWGSFADGRGGPELAGPSELVDLHTVLHDSAVDFAGAIDKVWKAHAAGQSITRGINLTSTSRETMLKHRTEYRALAIEYISPRDGVVKNARTGTAAQ